MRRGPARLLRVWLFFVRPRRGPGRGPLGRRPGLLAGVRGRAGPSGVRRVREGRLRAGPCSPQGRGGAAGRVPTSSVPRSGAVACLPARSSLVGGAGPGRAARARGAPRRRFVLTRVGRSGRRRCAARARVGLRADSLRAERAAAGPRQRGECDRAERKKRDPARPRPARNGRRRPRPSKAAPLAGPAGELLVSQEEHARSCAGKPGARARAPPPAKRARSPRCGGARRGGREGASPFSRALSPIARSRT